MADLEHDVAENIKFMESFIEVVEKTEIRSGGTAAPVALQKVLQALQKQRQGKHGLNPVNNFSMIRQGEYTSCYDSTQRS